MKIINKTGFISGIFMMILLWSCDKADQEFVHDSNTISQMICKASHGSSEFRGEIHEFDKNEKEVTGEFTQQDVEGGYGIILFEISKSLQDDVNLANIYLVATLTWDQSVTPSLSGRHDITGDGIIITVESGVGTTRQYRVRGYYQ
ncbi:MAG: hypothetical protein FWF53_05820 [Candidatus Azobacteroides sp.]|nr:hypothetical protein [Candidatus Azobacteroides sp.]